jgi:hypothetical protein
VNTRRRRGRGKEERERGRREGGSKEEEKGKEEREGEEGRVRLTFPRYQHSSLQSKSSAYPGYLSQ